jgi:alpha/beta superfamily hydrolase
MDVLFKNKDAGITLSGTLTLPSVEVKSPVVILIPGSGHVDRDSTFLDFKPFQIIADYLTRNGIAVLRFDKRGVGLSTGDFNTATTEDFSQDIFAAIEYLKSLKKINPNKIGLIGYSEGGIIASMVASRSKDVAFIVLMAAPVLSGKDNATIVFTLLVNESMTNAQNLHEDSVLFKRFFAIISKEILTFEENKEAIEIAEKTIPRMTEKTKATLGMPQLTPEMFLRIFSIPWLKAYLNINPESFLINVKCPIFAIYGKKDFQVPSKENIKALNHILKQRNKEDYIIKEIPDVNHLFQHCKTGYPSEYETIKESVSSEVLNLISAWITDKTKNTV